MIRIFSRYVGVQVFAYAIDMGTFLALSAGLGIDAIPANVIAKIMAGSFAFIAHRAITFSVYGQGGSGQQLVKYALLLALNIPLSSGLLAVLIPWLAPTAFAKLVADAICVLLTFSLSRNFVFTVPEAKGTEK